MGRMSRPRAPCMRAWPQMQERKAARMTEEQQSSASGALLGELFSTSARPAFGGNRSKDEEVQCDPVERHS